MIEAELELYEIGVFGTWSWDLDLDLDYSIHSRLPRFDFTQLLVLIFPSCLTAIPSSTN